MLFDLDGTLIDSTGSAERVWRMWAEQRGCDADHALRIMHGRRAVETVRIVAPGLDAQREADILTDMEVEIADGITTMPGAKELLSALHPGEWTLVTSCPERLARARMRAAGLPDPGPIISADRVTKGKPDAEPYAMGAQLLGVAPEYCVAVEDAPIGILSARAAGVRVIGLRTTFPEREIMVADFVVGSCADIRAVREEDGIHLHLR